MEIRDSKRGASGSPSSGLLDHPSLSAARARWAAFVPAHRGVRVPSVKRPGGPGRPRGTTLSSALVEQAEKLLTDGMPMEHVARQLGVGVMRIRNVNRDLKEKAA